MNINAKHQPNATMPLLNQHNTGQSQIHPAFQGTKVFRYPAQIPQFHNQRQPQEQQFNASAISPIFYGYSCNPYQNSRL